MSSKTKKESKEKGNLGKDRFNELAVLRVRNLLSNPDISQSQKKILLNILRQFEK